MSSRIEKIARTAVPVILMTGIHSTAQAEPSEFSPGKIVRSPMTSHGEIEETIEVDYFEELVAFLGLSSRIVEREKPVEGTTNCLNCGSSL